MSESRVGMSAAPSVLEKIPWGAAALIWAVSLVVAVGWIAEIPLLRSFLPGRVEMKLVTTVAFLLSASALLLLIREPVSRWRRAASYAAIGVVVALVALSLVEYGLLIDLGIGRLVGEDVPGAAETVHPGRMAPNTAAVILLLNVAMLLFERRRIASSYLSVTLSLVASLLTFFVLIGYLYDIQTLKGPLAFTPMSLPAAINCSLLCLGVLFARVKRPPLSLFEADTAGGWLLRGFLPAVVVLPVLLGWMRLRGEKLGLYRSEFGVALFAFALVVLTVLLVWYAARLLDREDRLRRTAEDTMRQVALAQRDISTAQLNFESVTNQLTLRSQQLTHADAAVLEIPQGQELVYRAASGRATPFVGTRLKIDTSFSGRSFRSGEILSCEDSELDDRVDREACRQVGARSMVAVPLWFEQKPMGVLKVYSSQPRAFTQNDIHALELMSGVAAATLAHASAFDRKQAQISEQFAELSALQHRFEAFMQNSPTIAFIKDSAGNYLYLNREVHGQKPEDRLGRTFFDWLPYPLASEMRERELEVLRSGRPSQTIEVVPYPDGQQRHYLVLRFPLHEGDREFLGGMSIDISDQVRAEEEVRKLNAELEKRVEERTAQLARANEELESFSYSVSHDLRTPLRAVDGYSRMLMEDYHDQLDEEARRFLTVIRDNTARMGELITDLLNFSRLSRQPIHLAPKVDVAQIARTVFQEVAGSVQPRQIDFRVEAAPAVPADAAMIRQVLQNLISNAVKFTGPREHAQIVFGGRTENGKVVYFVRDNGVGFDPRYSSKLFGVFQRLHHHDEFEGTGVGLAIVKRIIERHGGKVWAESEIQKGSTFYFALPQEPGEVATDATTKEAEIQA